MSRTRDRRPLPALPELLLWCLLLSVVWGLWLRHLAVSDLSFDEVATWYVARRPVIDMLRYLQKAIYEHPPVYYTLVHFWMQAAGSGEFSLRFFSLAAGLIALPLVGWTARRAFASPIRGLTAALFLAAMPGMAFYARNARMYSLGVVWITISSGLFLRDWLNEENWPRRHAVALLAVTHLLALFTHYYLILAILVQPLILLAARRWRPLLAWCALHGFLALPALVWLAMAPGLQASARGFRLFLHIPSFPDISQLLRLMVFSQAVRIPFPILYTVLALAGLGIIVAGVRRGWPYALWLAIVVVFPVALAYQLPRTPTERYLLFLLPPLALALDRVAAFPLSLSPALIGQGLSLALVLGMSGLLAGNGLSHVLNPREGGYGHTLRQVRACARPGDGVLFYGPWQWLPFQYYDPGGMPPITLLPPQAPPRLSPEEAEPVLEDLLARYDRLWVLPAAVDDVDPPHFAEGWLNTHAHPVWQTGDFALYLPPLPTGAPSTSPGLTFGDALRLERVAWESTAIAAGEPLRFTLYWVPLRALSGDVRVSLRLRDSRGNLWNEKHVIPREWADPPSRWQPGEMIPDYQGLMIPPGAPPGEYSVSIALSDEQTHEPLPADGNGETPIFSVLVEEPGAESGRRAVNCWLPTTKPTSFCPAQGSPCLTLVGYGSPQKVYPGYPLPVTLHWIAPDSPLPQNLSVRLRVVPLWPGVRQSPPLSVPFPLSPDYPPSNWQPGRLVTQMLPIPLPPETPPGPARLFLEVIGPDGTPWTGSDGRPTRHLLNLTVGRRAVLRFLPLGVRRTRVAFGDAIELRGYRIEGEARPGGTLRITYIWYARTRPGAVYAVFNHLLTLDGKLVAQADGWPQQGQMLTTQWLPRDYIEDHYTLHIPPDAPPGPYRLWMGMYNAITGERLTAIQNHQRVQDDYVPLALPGEKSP